MPYKRILVVLKGYLGDAVMATPLLNGLCNETDAEIHALTEMPVIELIEDTLPRVKYHASYDLAKLGGLMREVGEIRRLKFDLAICVNRSFRAAVLPALAKISVRVGHATDGRKWLLTRSIPYDEQRTEFESYLDLAKLAGIDLPSALPVLAPNPESVEEARAKLNGATVGIQPGARHDWKEIPLPTLKVVACSLQAEGHKLVLLGGPEEQKQGEALAQKLDQPVVNLVGKLSLKQSLATVSQLSLMVGGDTGLMHIAAAAGCPTVTAFGRTPPSKWAHGYQPHEVLIAPNERMEEIGTNAYLQAAERALRSR